MPYENFLVEQSDGVATLTINRPPANALSVATLAELDRILDEIENDATTRVVVITGAGEKFFSAGADVKEFGMIDPREQIEKGQALYRRIEAFGKPVIAALNGLTLGGGCELALACHLRFAAETAALGQPEVKLGIIPGWGGTQRLPRVLGRARGLEFLLTGDRISASDAERWGLVNRVFPASALMLQVQNFARRLAKGAPLALRAILECVDVGSSQGLDAGLELEKEKFLFVGQTEDAGTGVAAFLTKTEAEFKGK